MTDDKRKDPPVLTAEEARQGRIVLNSRRRRFVFFGGLIASVLLGALAAALWP